MNRGDRKMNFDTEFINCVDEIQRVALEIYGKYDLEKSMLWMTEEFGEFFKSIRKEEDSYECLGKCLLDFWYRSFSFFNTISYR